LAGPEPSGPGLPAPVLAQSLPASRPLGSSSTAAAFPRSCRPCGSATRGGSAMPAAEGDMPLAQPRGAGRRADAHHRLAHALALGHLHPSPTWREPGGVRNAHVVMKSSLNSASAGSCAAPDPTPGGHVHGRVGDPWCSLARPGRYAPTQVALAGILGGWSSEVHTPSARCDPSSRRGRHGCLSRGQGRCRPGRRAEQLSPSDLLPRP